MTAILRVRYTVGLSNGLLGLFQTYWRPGTAGGVVADASDCLARVRAALVTMQPTYGAGTSFVPQAGVDVLEDTTGALIGGLTGAIGLSVSGTAVGDQMPVQTAYLVRHTTSLVVGRRRLRGRTFLPGPTESQNDPSGRPSTASILPVNNAFNALLTGGTTASFPVVWARPTKLPAVRAGTSGAITSSSVQPAYWGSQRDRRF